MGVANMIAEGARRRSQLASGVENFTEEETLVTARKWCAKEKLERPNRSLRNKELEAAVFIHFAYQLAQGPRGRWHCKVRIAFGRYKGGVFAGG